MTVGKAKTPAPTKLFAGNQNKVDLGGKPTATENDKTTIKFTVDNKPCTVYVKYKVNDQELTEVIDVTKEATSLDITQELQHKLPLGTVVSFKAIEPNKEPSDVVTATVVRDADNDGNKDAEPSEKPSIKTPIKKGEKIISGKAAVGADVIVKITPKSTVENPNPTTIEKRATAGSDGTFTVATDDPLNDGDTIVATATEKNKTPTDSDPVTVGVDTTELEKAIKEGEKKLEGKPEDKYTPADKKLKEAIEAGKAELNNPTSQTEVGNKTKAINDAIKDKDDYDAALDKLKKLVEEADGKKNDPEYKSKPKNVKDDLKKAAQEGDKTAKNKDSEIGNINTDIKAIEDALKEYNKQQISVNIIRPLSGTSKIELLTIPGNARFKVYVGIINDSNLKGEGVTSSKGIGTITLIETKIVEGKKIQTPLNLVKGMNISVVVEHDDYLSRTEIVRVR